MTCPPAPAAGRDGCVRAYETLRAQALGRAGGTAADLLLVLGQGVPAWIARRSLCPDPPLPAPAAESRRLDHRQSDLVRVLADMALVATAQQTRP